MTRIVSVSAAGLASLAALCLNVAAAAADCAQLAAFNQALEGKDLRTMKAIEARISTDAACGPFVLDVQRRRANLEVAMAEAIKGRGRDAEREELLVDADRTDVTWTAAVGVGELRFGQRRFADSALAFDRAIEIIKNETKTPKAPSSAVIQEVVDRATQARLLAANEEGPTPAAFTPAVKDHRDGSIGGSFSADVRGFKPKSVPLPINFETGTAKATRLGLQAAAELLAAIKEQHPSEILIVGHTDERGGDAYNMRLSEQRAIAVGKYLADNGVDPKTIKILARGKSEPLKIEDAGGLSRQDIWALNRRVEWRRQ
jgi:outer membrane protein OmpA-like peptidoglycan-associated protein